MSNTESHLVIPSSPADQQAIKQFLDAGSDALTRIALERETINDIVKEVAEKFDLDKKYVRKMINIHYKSNLKEVDVEHNDIVELYQAVTGIKIDEA